MDAWKGKKLGGSPFGGGLAALQRTRTPRDQSSEETRLASAYVAGFADMPVTLPADSDAGGELLSTDDVNDAMVDTAKQRSLLNQQRAMNRGPQEEPHWRPSPGASSSSRWATSSVGSSEPHVW
eukprot:1302563-Alexandrium_andersonii.AAC.1